MRLFGALWKLQGVMPNKSHRDVFLLWWMRTAPFTNAFWWTMKNMSMLRLMVTLGCLHIHACSLPLQFQFHPFCFCYWEAASLQSVLLWALQESHGFSQPSAEHCNQLQKVLLTLELHLGKLDKRGILVHHFCCPKSYLCKKSCSTLTVRKQSCRMEWFLILLRQPRGNKPCWLSVRSQWVNEN